MGNSASTTVGVVILALTVVACDSSVSRRDNPQLSPHKNSSDPRPDTAVSVTAIGANSDSTGITTQITTRFFVPSHTDGNHTAILLDSEDSIGDFFPDIGLQELTLNSDAYSNIFSNSSLEFFTHRHSSTSASSDTSIDFVEASESSNNTATATAISTVTESESDTGSTGSASSNISIDLSRGSDLTGSAEPNIEFCVQVGEIVEFGVAGRVYDLETGFTLSNLTAYSNVDHWNHPNVQVISHSDEGISVTLTEEDVVDLAVQYENEINQVFISAINNGGSRPLLLKKRFHYDGCGFALYTSSGCDFITSSSDQASLNVDGISITTEECSIVENFDNVPVLEIK